MSLTIQEKEMLKELETLGIRVNADNKNIDIHKNNYKNRKSIC